MRSKRVFLFVFVCTALAFILLSCAKEKTSKPSKSSKKGSPTSLILATTTSIQDTGLLDELLPLFEKKYNVSVKPIAVGTGEAIAMGQRGEADVLLVHSKEAEDKFVQDGYGKNHEDVMYNDFVMVGPSSDPAKIKGKDAVFAFKKIAEAQATFVSRGDDSGTHKKEKKIWQQARHKYKIFAKSGGQAGITPKGNWYLEVGQGMGETLRIANEKQAYTLADKGTYLVQKKSINLKILVRKKEKILLNPYGVIVVNPKKFPKVNYKDAMRFTNWITSYEVQKIIKDFGKKKYGQSLFVPNSAEWKAKHKD